MKRFLLVLGFSVSLAGALSAQTADASRRPSNRSQSVTKARQNAATDRSKKADKAVYHITDYTATGSHIPQVVTRYQGTSYTSGSYGHGSVYSGDDIGATGELNLGDALRTLDPAIITRTTR